MDAELDELDAVDAAAAATAAAAQKNKLANIQEEEGDEDYWIEKQDPKSGKTYYVNKKTRVSSWKKPAGAMKVVRMLSQAAGPTNGDGEREPRRQSRRRKRRNSPPGGR